MLQRSTQICGVERCDIGQQRLNVVHRHFQRHDGRWSILGERRRHLIVLRKRRMRVQSIERSEPLVPVRQTTQRKERRCRPDRIHTFTGYHHMAARAHTLRHLLSDLGVTIHLHDGDFNLFRFGQLEHLNTVDREGSNGALTNFRADPIRKTHDPRMLGHYNLQAPSLVQPRKHRLALISQQNLGLRTLVYDRYAHLCFEGKTGQHVFQQTALDQCRRRVQTKFPFIRNGLNPPTQDSDNRENGHAKPKNHKGC